MKPRQQGGTSLNEELSSVTRLNDQGDIREYKEKIVPTNDY